MASGNTLCTFFPADNEPPTASFATLDTRNSHPVLDFDASADEHAVFTGVLPRHYAGGGITVTLYWGASSATTGNVIWNTAVERLEDEGTDTDADSFATANASSAVACPSTSGAIQYTTIAHTSGAQMDSLAAGEMFRIKVTRDADNGSDTMTGDAELFAVEIKET
jgi:hypothetical protein